MEIKLPEKGKRYIELDSLRGLAALAVFFSHVVNMSVMPDWFYRYFDKSIFHLLWDGTAAVMFFFVLSGFVLSLPYIGETGRQPDYLPFIIKRIFRIYPAYLLALVISVLLKIYLFTPEGLAGFSQFGNQFWQWRTEELSMSVILKHAAMIGPKFEMGQIDPIIWSLVVEMKVSVLLPVILLFFKELKSAWTQLALVFATAVAYRLADLDMIERIPLLNDDTLFYIPMFMAGILLAKYRHCLSDFVKRQSQTVNAAAFIFGLLLYSGRFSLAFLLFSYNTYFYITALGACIIVVYAVALPERFTLLVSRPARFLGDISYSFYLLHFPIMLAFGTIIYMLSGLVFAPYILSLVLSFALSYAVYKWVEMPFQSIGRVLAKRPFIYGRAEGTAANAPLIGEKLRPPFE